jgi:hypothetical protein
MRILDSMDSVATLRSFGVARRTTDLLFDLGVFGENLDVEIHFLSTRAAVIEGHERVSTALKFFN